MSNMIASRSIGTFKINVEVTIVKKDDFCNDDRILTDMEANE